MKKILLFFLLLLVVLLAGCGIPDLPGPIGIPGI
jgi:predicted small lipoprotein YifL